MESETVTPDSLQGCRVAHGVTAKFTEAPWGKPAAQSLTVHTQLILKPVRLGCGSGRVDMCEALGSTPTPTRRKDKEEWELPSSYMSQQIRKCCFSNSFY
jgi:hypothetical protein